MRAELAVLVHADVAGNDQPIADFHVPGQCRIVGEHHAVADLAVVRDVHVGQQPVVVTDAGDTATLAGAAVDRDELADQVAIADHQFGALAGKLLVLRGTTDRGELADPVVAADPGGTLDYHVRADHGALADLHVRTDHAVGANGDVRADDRARIDLRGGVDHLSDLAAHISSQLATSLPSTSERATNRPMPRISRLSETSSRNWSPGTTGALKRALSTLAR